MVLTVQPSEGVDTQGGDKSVHRHLAKKLRPRLQIRDDLLPNLTSLQKNGLAAVGYTNLTADLNYTAIS